MKTFLPRALLKAIFFGLSYYLSVRVGMLFIADSVAFFWPASGIACGFFIFSEKKLWPFYSFIFIPAYILPLIVHGGYSNAAMALLCLANLTQSIVAGVLIHRYIQKPIDINRLRSLSWFMALSAVVAPLIAGLIGIPTLYFFFGSLSLFDYFLFWMVGNCAGILPVIIFISAVVKIKKYLRQTNSPRYYYERIGFGLAYVGLIYWMVETGADLTLAEKVVPYFIFPCILFSSIRFGARYTGVLALIFAGFSAYFSAQGSSPYLSASLPTVYNAISFDIFIIILTSTGLLLAALQFELDFARKQLQKEKNEALELSQLKSQFIANVNHEIRTPVTGIVGAADLLSGSKLSPDQARLVSVVRESCGYLLSLINNVLEFSRLENKKVDLDVSEFNLEVLTHGVIKSFFHMANEKGIAIYMSCKTDKVLIESDPTAMQQVIGNLLTNAIKYTNSGEVIISIYEQEGLKLSVKDTGIGISNDKIEHIFESFTQEDTSMNRKYGGAGLGLAIVEKIIQLIPGWVSVESIVGKGSEFTLNFLLPSKRAYEPLIADERLAIEIYSNNAIQNDILKSYLEGKVTSVSVHGWSIDGFDPSARDSNNIALIHWDGLDSQRLSEFCKSIRSGRYIFILPWFMDRPRCYFADFISSPVYTRELLECILGVETDCDYTPAESSAKAKWGIRVLLADDNDVNAMIVQSILEKRGCHVILAENGSVALEKAKVGRYDLILMDIQMPVMDGFSATREIRKFAPDVTIVAFTANSNDQLISEFEAAGMNSVLSKPVNNDVLDTLLNDVWQTSQVS